MPEYMSLTLCSQSHLVVYKLPGAPYWFRDIIRQLPRDPYLSVNIKVQRSQVSLT